MEYQAQLEEYRALKTEIVANLDSGRQVVSLTLTALGALIAAIPFVLQRKATVVFLLAPLLFYALAWTQLRYTFLVLDMGTYLREILIPGLRNSIRTAQSGPVEEDVLRNIMGWEYFDASLLRSKNRAIKGLMFPVAGANYGVPLLASAGSIAGYFVSRGNTVDPWLVLVLTALDSFLFIYSLALGILAELSRGRVTSRFRAND